MKTFLVYTPGEKVYIKADELIEETASIKFFKNDRCVAKFYKNCISGWCETEIPKDVVATPW